MPDDLKGKTDFQKVRDELDKKYKPKNIMDVIEMGLDGLHKWSDDASEKRRKTYAGLSDKEKFKLWSKLESWNLKDEAIPLVLGFSPDYVSHLKDYPADQANIIFKIAESCMYGSLPLLNPDDPVEKWKVDSHKFIGWAYENNTNVSREFISVFEEQNPDHRIHARQGNNLPEYSTPLLRIAIYVINEFWEGVDFKRAPSREWMVEHLIDKFSLDERDAKVVDALTRDPKRRKKTYTSEI